MERRVPDSITTGNWGPNRSNFIQGALGFGFIVGESGDAIPINYGGSNFLNLGLMYNRKLSNLFALGVEVDYWRMRYNLEQSNGKAFPLTAQFDKELFIYHNLGPAGFLRVSFNPGRGNQLGLFLDMGGGLNWTVSLQHRYKLEDNRGVDTKVKETDLPYRKVIHPFLQARLGWNHWQLTLRYRPGDNLAPGNGPAPDLPQWALGIALGIY